MIDKSVTLSIDFGEKYIGVALVAHSPDQPNRVLYATTLVVESKPLKSLVENRAATRRLRRTRKTHTRRLKRLTQALASIPNAAEIVRFCRRRGFSHDAGDDQDDQTFHLSREQFFVALGEEVERRIPLAHRSAVLSACGRHLNATRRKAGELRPARFENRGRARCNWQGCRHNVPRAGNDLKGRLQQSLFLWLQPIFEHSADVPRLRKSLEHWVDELSALSKALVRAAESPAPEDAARKRVNERIKRVYRNLRDRIQQEAAPDVWERFDKNWAEFFRPQLSELIRGAAGGRVRFCREHSAQFVEFTVARRPIPIRQEIDDRDLISRTQQIVFQRILRLVSGRLLPLTDLRIDRVVVERVAFDVLSGPIKARQSLSEAKAYEIYWYGPQAGYDSRQLMLEAEFGGRCAYCGEQQSIVETEHICHRSEFPFDSYFNVVSSCRACNARKGGRTALDAGLTIHEQSYEAYCAYLHDRRVLHPYHTIKKGILNLLRRPATVERGQQLIALIADNLVTITNTQRSPRPLARYLASRIAKLTGSRPKIEFRAGRHTALYRNVILPEFDKAAEKAAGDVRNHAIDAVLLGCDLPSAAALENRQWNRTAADIAKWMSEVRQAAPALQEGVPVVEPVSFVPFFENDLGNGYCSIDLSAFNWNRRRKATHKLDPFGKTREGMPLKRIPATDVLAALTTKGSDREEQIEVIAHIALRRKLEADPDRSAELFITWLQQRTGAGLKSSEMSSHPADRERRRLLEQFVQTPVSAFLSRESPAAIPFVIGIRCLNRAGPATVNVRRTVDGNPLAQLYQSQPTVKQFYVCYRAKNGVPNRLNPLVLAVTQSDELRRWRNGKSIAFQFPDDSPLAGRSLGAHGRLREFRSLWSKAFEDFCREEGVVERFQLTQGCVIEKIDGSLFQIRNFDKSEPWMKGRPFVNIRQVHRTPFRVM